MLEQEEVAWPVEGEKGLGGLGKGFHCGRGIQSLIQKAGHSVPTCSQAEGFHMDHSNYTKVTCRTLHSKTQLRLNFPTAAYPLMWKISLSWQVWMVLPKILFVDSPFNLGHFWTNLLLICSFFSLTLASFKSLESTSQITALTQVLGGISVLLLPLDSACHPVLYLLYLNRTSYYAI